MSIIYKMSTKLAVVRVSSKDGRLKTVWVYDHRSDGWLLGGEGQTYAPQLCWAWWAPHHVLKVVEACKGHDWNGIKLGALVSFGSAFDDDTIGIVIERVRSQYIILRSDTNQITKISWECVRPIEVTDQDSCKRPGGIVE